MGWTIICRGCVSRKLHIEKNEMRTRHGQMGLKRTKCPPTYIRGRRTNRLLNRESQSVGSRGIRRNLMKHIDHSSGRTLIRPLLFRMIARMTCVKLIHHPSVLAINHVKWRAVLKVCTETWTKMLADDNDLVYIPGK